MRSIQLFTASVLTAALGGCFSAKLHADPIQLSPGMVSKGARAISVNSSATPLGYVSPSSSISVGTTEIATFSRTTGQFEIDEAGVTYGGTAFSNGIYVVGAGGFQGPGDGGQISLTFSYPVIQFALNAEEFNGGPYTVDFSAFDVNGNSVAYVPGFYGPYAEVYTSSGDDPIDGTAGTLSFEGLTSTADPISKVVFYDTPSGSNDLLFGNISYVPVGTVLAPAPPAATPEPSTLALFGTGVLSLAGFGRSTRRAFQNRLAR